MGADLWEWRGLWRVAVPSAAPAMLDPPPLVRCLPMLFNVATLLREPVGSTRKYALDPEEPVHKGSVELLRVPTGVLVRAKAEVFVEAACSRCLTPFAYPVHI